MERLNALVTGGVWECRRGERAVLRKVGVFSLLLLMLMTACAVAAWVSLNARPMPRTAAPPPQQASAKAPEPARLVDGVAAFEKRLAPEAEVSAVIQDILKWAEDERLVIDKADYSHQQDAAGRFTRVRMTMPVKGDAVAIQRLISKALKAHAALALSSAHFQRDRIDAKEVEARLQWVLMTRSAQQTPLVAPRVSP